MSARRLSTVARNSQTVSVKAVSTRQKLSDTELAQENSQVDSHLKREVSTQPQLNVLPHAYLMLMCWYVVVV